MCGGNMWKVVVEVDTYMFYLYSNGWVSYRI